MVERARLESGAWETTRGFESLPLRSGIFRRRRYSNTLAEDRGGVFVLPGSVALWERAGHLFLATSAGAASHPSQRTNPRDR